VRVADDQGAGGLRGASHRGPHAAPTPRSGHVLEKAGLPMVQEMDDADEEGNVVRVEQWELAV
jgi:hypothetical protein